MVEIAWGIVGVAFALLVGVGVSLLGLSPPEYNIARACFWSASILLGVTTLSWALRTQQPTWWRISAGVAVWLCIGVGLPETLRWLRERQRSISQDHSANSNTSVPTIHSVVEPTRPLDASQKKTDAVLIAHAKPLGKIPERPTYNKLSNAELGHEIIRVCASINVIAEREEAHMSDIGNAMDRAEAGKPRSGDASLSDQRLTWFKESDAFTAEVREQYFPELSALRLEALRRLKGKVAEDPNEKRMWDALVSYVESPPSPITGLHLEECVRYLSKIGETVESLDATSK